MGIKARLSECLHSDDQALIDLRFLGIGQDQHTELFLAAQQLCRQKGSFYLCAQSQLVSFDETHLPKVGIAGAASLVKTIRKEHPSLVAKAVVLDQELTQATMIAQKIANEIISGGPEDSHILYKSNGSRWLPKLREVAQAELSDQSWRPLDPGSVIVVSGGGRGVTAQSLIRLAQQQTYKFLILGRSQLSSSDAFQDAKTQAEIIAKLYEEARSQGRAVSPKDLGREARKVLANREIHENIARLKELGSEVIYEPCDILSRDDVNAACMKAKSEWGQIHAIVHGAGVLADKSIVDKSIEDFNWVYRTKVEGFINLLSVCELRSLKSVCVFSSVAGRMGNPGQSDYGVANEVLTQICVSLQQAHSHLLCRSIAWGPWDGGMVDPSLRQHFKQQGIKLIPIDEGSQYFANLFHIKSEAIEYVVGGLLQTQAVKEHQGVSKFRIHVSERTHSYLNSHRVHDKVVIPVVVLAEWVARVSGHQDEITWQNLQVRKGIVIDDFAQGAWLDLIVEADRAGDKVQVWCQNQLRFQALLKKGTQTAKLMDLDRSTLHSWQREHSPYDDTLFHGSDFQVIERLEEIGEQGCSALLRTDCSLDGRDDHWLTNSAALDGGLQLAVTWFRDHSSYQALPTELGSLEVFGKTAFNEKTRCVLKVKEVSKLRSIWDIDYLSVDGRLQARIRDLTIHAVPSGY